MASSGPGPPPRPAAGAIDPAEVSARLEHVAERVEAAGSGRAAPRIVAVTKGFGVTAVEAALACGLNDVGENYAQELEAKATSLAERRPGGPSPRWHFLGRVQRNKVPRLASTVSWWQALARGVEGLAVQRHAPGATVLVEVETTGDPARVGVRPGEVPALVGELVDLGLDVRGLMTVAPPGPEAAAECFATVRRLGDRLGLPELSMGMSDDLELAVRSGSTMIRLGRALFGPRAPRGSTKPPR